MDRIANIIRGNFPVHSGSIAVSGKCLPFQLPALLRLRGRAAHLIILC